MDSLLAGIEAPPQPLFSVRFADDARHKPQEGPQEALLQSDADIVIYGGEAGGGKSWGLLAEPLKDHEDGDFGAVIFRRTSKQVLNEGGLWDESQDVYPDFGATSNQSRLEWTFPSGARVTFAHLEHEKNKLDWQGSQIALLGFDELTHFSETQFWYMLSRNRSKAKARKRVRATTNPDADSWVADLIAWWIDQDEKSLTYGLPIDERSGVIRWFIRIKGDLVWGDSREELLELHPGSRPKSLTFIRARLADNRILQEKDPDYEANLEALPLVERERLKGGNWKVRGESGKFFNESWFTGFVDRVPAGGRRVRYWDKAGTEGGGGARSAGVLISYFPATSRYVVEDAVFGRWGAMERERMIRQTAELDGKAVEVWVEQEPGSGGKESAEATVRLLNGFTIRVDRVSDPKHVRWGPWSSQVEGGNVDLLRGAWNRDYIKEHHGADPEKDVPVDMVDASSGAMSKLAHAAPRLARVPSSSHQSI